METVKDLMMPLAEYGIVDVDASVKDALDALEAAQDNLADGRQPNRAVLVRNQRGEIVGKLGHLAFLRALLPERTEFDARDEGYLAQAGVSDEMRHTSQLTMELLDDDLVNICERASSQRVGDVCALTTASIHENASLLDAVRVFNQNQTLSLLVTRGHETIGIIRLADLFDHLAGKVRAGDCGPAQ